MIRFSWLIHNEASHVNPSLRLLNDALQKTGGQARLEKTPRGSRLVIELGDSTTTTGRPRTGVKEDFEVYPLSRTTLNLCAQIL